MLTKLAIALLLGAVTANEAERYSGPKKPTGPRGRSGPRGSSGPSSARFADKFKDKGEKEDYELDLDFEASPDEHEKAEQEYDHGAVEIENTHPDLEAENDMAAFGDIHAGLGAIKAELGGLEHEIGGELESTYNNEEGFDAVNTADSHDDLSKSWPIEECPLEACEHTIEDIFEAVDEE